MKITKLLLGLLFVGIFHFSYAQNPEEMMNLFFNTYKQNKPIEALNELYSHTPWLERIRDDVEKLKTQFGDLKTLVGEYNGHELLYKKNVKGCFVMASYLVKYDRQPVRINFEFYKPKDKWFLYSFSYDDNLEVDIDKAMKDDILEMSE